MARYNRIVNKKKTDASDLLVATPTSLMDHLRDNLNMVFLGLGLVTLAVAGVYGVSYYKSSAIESAQGKLYKASSMVPAEGAPATAADEAIKTLNEIVGKGGSAEIVLQGRLELAALYTRKGDHQSALAQYSAAAKEAPKGGMLWEVAAVGEANSMSMSGKYVEAAGKFKELSESTKYYPKQELLYGYGLNLAASGDKDVALKALNRIKTEFPDYLSPDYLADTIARVESGKFVMAMKSASPSMADASSKPQEQPASTDKVTPPTGG